MLEELILFIMIHPILSISWVTLLVFVIAINLDNYAYKVKVISRREAIELINKGNSIIVDTRNSYCFHQGHLTNSINLTAHEIKNGEINMLGNHKTNLIIVVCDNGITSKEAAKKLKKSGFNNVVVLKEGIDGWNSVHLPLVCKK